MAISNFIVYIVGETSFAIKRILIGWPPIFASEVHGDKLCVGRPRRSGIRARDDRGVEPDHEPEHHGAEHGAEERADVRPEQQPGERARPAASRPTARTSGSWSSWPKGA